MMCSFFVMYFQIQKFRFKNVFTHLQHFSKEYLRQQFEKIFKNKFYLLSQFRKLLKNLYKSFIRFL